METEKETGRWIDRDEFKYLASFISTSQAEFLNPSDHGIGAKSSPNFCDLNKGSGNMNGNNQSEGGNAADPPSKGGLHPNNSSGQNLSPGELTETASHKVRGSNL